MESRIEAEVEGIPVYDEAAAERQGQRVIQLFHAELPTGAAS